jgi:hypothetical protein
LGKLLTDSITTESPPSKKVCRKKWAELIKKIYSDQEIVMQLSIRSYKDVDRDLGYLALLYDAPVIRIGDVWKAKSYLELLVLFGDRIIRGGLWIEEVISPPASRC